MSAHFKAVNAFEEWVVDTSSDDLIQAKQEPNSLADYIHDWVWSGVGVHACHGSFEVYLAVVIEIIDEWLRANNEPHSRTYLNYLEDLGDEGEYKVHERSAIGIFHGPDTSDRIILERHFFDRYVFRTLHGKPPYGQY